jgi:predicted RNA-binding Zn ribbon-like protein
VAQPFPALFIADSRGLDLLNSVATPVDVAIDWIADGDGLLSWLAQARLVSAAVLSAVRTHAMPGELDRLAAQARSLREWFRGFVHEHRGRPLEAADLGALEPLNLLLARDDGFGQIVAQRDGAAGLALQRSRRWSSPESLLLPIGEILASLVCEEDFSYIKPCEGPVCSLLFADHTRARARRWCSMSACGNRAKQAAHRDRIKRQR